MKFSGLQFSFGISLAVHAMAFGVAAWTGVLWQPAVAPGGDGVITLILTAAPATRNESSGAGAVAPASIPTAPAPPQVEPVPDAVAPTPLPIESVPSPLRPESPPPAIAPQLAPATDSGHAPTVLITAEEPAGNRSAGSTAGLGTDSATMPGGGAGTVATPSYLRNPAPPYPAEARRRRWEGVVLLNVRVSAQGRAAAVSVQQSSGHDALDAAALAAVRDWDFEPARLGPVAIESRIEVAVRFTLKR